MKKRFSCFILSIVMLLSTILMCSCPAAVTPTSEEEEEEEKVTTSRNPMTLSLWIPTDESTTQQAINEVAAEINKVTTAKFNTAIEFHAIPYDDYKETVDTRMTEIEDILTRTKEEERARKEAEREARKKGETIATTAVETTETAGETTDEDGFVVTSYPDVNSTQMDIFLINGYEDFMNYANNALLSSIEDELNGSSKLMKSYIYPTFLESANVFGSTYAVPNSHPLGEYTYLLINKELCDSFYYDPESFDSVLACEEFIHDVAQNSDVTPLLSTVDATGILYWGNDNNEFSILSTIIPDEQEYTTRLNVRNIFGLKAYVNTTIMMKKIEEAGYTNPNAKEFGVGVITGTQKDVEQYEEDYYINVIRKPRATTDDVFQSMFAVSTYTKDVGRSVEVINLLNTDSDFRTLLQYGVEGVHWAVDEEKSTELEEIVIKRLNNDYTMNLVDTGNVFITYPDEGVPMSYWDDGIQQNLDSKVDSLLRFVNYIDNDNREYYEELWQVSAAMKKRIDAMTAEEFEASVEALKDEVTNSDPYVYLTDDEAEDYESLVNKYSSFYSEYVRSDD